jgi:putative PIN family toxin of toxin-antitoxin system
VIVVLDTNCIVAGLLTRDGPCAVILDRWRDGQFEVAVSPNLLAELTRVLQYPRIVVRYHVASEMADAAVGEFQSQGVTFADAPAPARVVPGDIDDDYIIALAVSADAAALVTRDRHFAGLDPRACRAAVLAPEDFLERLRADES